MKKSRVIIVVNKYWECDPVCWVLTNKYINERCGIDLGTAYECITYPSYGPVIVYNAESTEPRLVFETKEKIIEVWCISDLLSTSKAELQSSSEEKMKFLPYIYEFNAAYAIELVIAVGTASSGPCITEESSFGSDNINGSVVVGSKVFLHDGGDAESLSHYVCNCWDEVLKSSTTEFIDKLSQIDFTVYNELMLCPPTNPATNGQNVYVNNAFVALGDVNVTDYKKYAIKDEETGNAYLKNYAKDQGGVSLETTHCLIYKAAKDHLQGNNPPFIFVSGEVDRYTKFDKDVNPKVYAQNVSGAHNAGVVLAKIISMLNS